MRISTELARQIRVGRAVRPWHSVATPPPPPSGGALFDWGGVAYRGLEITRPHSTMDANDRWRSAYPGLPWEVRIGAIGGVYPYLYELVSGPPGMTINNFTGKLTWLNPVLGTYPGCQIRVTDTKGTSLLSATWTLTVDPARFRFFDAVNGNSTWNGLSPTFTGGTTGPKRTMADFWTIGNSTFIGYFLNGTYTNAGLTAQSDGIRWTVGTNRPSIWLPYPGHTPVVDFEKGAQWDFGEGSSSPRIYIDGFEFTNMANKGFRFHTADNVVIWRNYFHDQGPGAQSANSGYIDYESGSFSSGAWERHCIQDNRFGPYTPSVGPAPNCCFKLYSTDRMLLENNIFDGQDIQGEDEEAISNKAGNRWVTVRGNIGINLRQGVFGGNQNSALNGFQCDFEFCFNHIKVISGKTILINHDHTSNAHSQIYRNTFEGPVVWDELQTQNGPYTYRFNVVVNNNGAIDNPDGSGITHNVPPQDITRITASDNIFGSPSAGIIDGNGLLTSAYEEFRYRRGHQVPA